MAETVPKCTSWLGHRFVARYSTAAARFESVRDWIECSITLRRGLTGAKPEAVCHWAFEMVGARPEDSLDDMFPGTGAVAEAWRTWQGKFTLPADHQEEFAAIAP